MRTAPRTSSSSRPSCCRRWRRWKTWAFAAWSRTARRRRPTWPTPTRASRRPGICLAQTIGSANLPVGLRDAYMACSPVTARPGGLTAPARYRHTYQEIEDFPMWEQVTKATSHVDALERFPDLLRQAFRAATSAAPGPVHLEMAGTHAQVLEGEAELTPFW